MLLNYFALFMLFFVGIVLFYGIIIIHDIPYEIAKKRNHPHLDAIHAAGWVSIFTLHAIWPFLWIWATLWREDRGWGFIQIQEEQYDLHHKINLLGDELQQLKSEIRGLKDQGKNSDNAGSKGVKLEEGGVI